MVITKSEGNPVKIGDGPAAVILLRKKNSLDEISATAE